MYILACRHYRIHDSINCAHETRSYPMVSWLCKSYVKKREKTRCMWFFIQTNWLVLYVKIAYRRHAGFPQLSCSSFVNSSSLAMIVNHYRTSRHTQTAGILLIWFRIFDIYNNQKLLTRYTRNIKLWQHDSLY